MAQLTENDLQLLDTADLQARAEVIRDAVAAKTISAQQVGQLFCDLTEACGDINRAVRLFLSVNVPELQNDIDARLAGADAAAANAAAEIQRSQQTRALVEALVAKLSTQNLNARSVWILPRFRRSLLSPTPCVRKSARSFSRASASALSCSSATTRRSKLHPTDLCDPWLSAVLRSTLSPQLTHRFINRFASKWCHRACASLRPVPSASTAKVT